MTIFGALVIHAMKAVPDVLLPSLDGMQKRAGHHVFGRYNGRWTEISDLPSSDVYLPQRYKSLTVTTTNPDAHEPICRRLEGLDSEYVTARQLYKLHKLIEGLNAHEFASAVNIAAATQDNKPISGSFYLLSNGVPLYMSLVFDQREHSVQLVWSTYDFREELRVANALRYVVYNLPTVYNRPVHVPTQILCARWWNFTKGSGNKPLSYLQACNALEMFLFKDPTKENYEPRG